ncbi:MAG TPA: hypothetical protein VKR38_06780 [Usitatibacter sp.]|nr:hypothetical protein [Usitatibacter sp.]
MQTRFRQQGTLFILAALLLVLLVGTAFALQLARAAGSGQRDRITERALAEAREALIAYAADRSIDAIVGPGYLPCPDLDDDGWAESTCGSLAGDSGQAQRLGRLPWKTLGIPDLRDGHGERLWYAVSSKYKGLLNCGVSRACVDMSPGSALGTITVRDASGLVIHDGTVAEDYRSDVSGALAVVLAPGPPLVRADGREQVRECAPALCDGNGRCTGNPPSQSPHCDPRNYLDVAAHARFAYEDNADFVDRNDAAGRAGNTNGFIRGPVVLPDGRLAVNDRLTAIAYRDVMPRLMERVAMEVSSCLRSYASRSENGTRFPWPSPACAQKGGAWDGRRGVHFGRIPNTPFDAMAAQGRLDRWQDAGSACSLASADGSTAGLGGVSWWTAWKPYVFYGLAPEYSADGAAAACAPGSCIDLVDSAGRPLASSKRFAVIVAGPALERDGFVQHRDAAAIAEIESWLEESNAKLEGSAGCGDGPPPFACETAGTCGRVTVGMATRTFNDAVVAWP